MTVALEGSELSYINYLKYSSIEHRDLSIMNVFGAAIKCFLFVTSSATGIGNTLKVFTFQ